MCTPQKAKKWLPWQHPLVVGTGNICILLANHSNPLHNQQPSRYHSHKASYSNFSAKIGCHGNIPQNLEIGYVFIGQLDLENPALESNIVPLPITQPNLQFIESQKVVAIATSLIFRVSAISAFCWSTNQTPLHNQVPSRHHSHKASYSNFSPKIGCHGNDHQTLYLGYVFIGLPDPKKPPLESNSVLLAIVQPRLQPIENQKMVAMTMWQHPLVAGYQQYLHFVGRLLKPPSITNHIVAIIHTKPVIANCIPKLVAMATSLSTSGCPTHDSLGPSEPTTQMASRSVQPSLHK